MLVYLSSDIICSSELTVSLEFHSRITVWFSEQITSADNYPSIFSRQMECYCLYVIIRSANERLQIDRAIHHFLKSCRDIRKDRKTTPNFLLSSHRYSYTRWSSHLGAIVMNNPGERTTLSGYRGGGIKR